MEQRQRKKGAVDRINTGVDTIRKAQTAIKIARTAGTAAEAVATSEVWAPVAIIVGVILLIIIFVVIIIVATGGGTGSANPALSPTPAPDGGTGSNTCTQQYEGTGYCSVSNLMPYFGNDSTKTLIASLICSGESGSDPFNLNNACTRGESLDYSIGLFQINALAHCSPPAFSYTSSPISCTVIDYAAKQSCEARLFSTGGNIEAAVGISSNGSDWTAWSTWSHAGRIPPVRDILTRCGISY